MKTSFRFFLLGLALVAPLAFAQPVNDTCTGAELIDLTQGQTVLSTVHTDWDLATFPVTEKAMTCRSSTFEKNTMWFQIVPPVSGMYRIDTCGRANFPTTVAVYAGSDCTNINQVTLIPDGGGTNAVSCNTSNTTDPRCTNQSLVEVNLNAGATYWIQAGAHGPNPTDGGVLQVQVSLQNPQANEDCPGAVPLTLEVPVLAMLNGTPTDRPAFNDVMLPGDGGCLTPSIGNPQINTNASGRDLVFSFRAPQTASYSFRAGPQVSGSNNLVSYVVNSCVPRVGTTPAIYDAPICIAAANRANSGNIEENTCVPLTANQTVAFVVDESGFSDTVVGQATPVEVTRCMLETEPNQTPPQGSALSCPVTASIDISNEVDFFKVGRYPGARLYALAEHQSTLSGDLEMRATTGTNTLEFDDNDGANGTNTPAIAGVTLPDEPAYLRVNYRTTALLHAYRLYPMLKFGTPTPETEPNDTLAAANTGATWFSGSLPTLADVDTFAIDLQAGDLFFAALDHAPDRQPGASANPNMKLLEPDGFAVMAPLLGNSTVDLGPPDAGLVSRSPAIAGDSLVFRARKTGRHYVQIVRTASTGQSNYHLAMSVQCGMIDPRPGSVSPTSGTSLGNETLTITGVNFDETTRVFLGPNEATITSRSPTSLVVTTPSGLAGAVDVQTINFGERSAQLSGAFTYVDPIIPPVVTSLSPSFGPPTGGTRVTITGVLFKLGAEVRFGVGGVEAPCTSVTVLSATRLTCLTPALALGNATVTVRNPVDALEGSLVDGFTYQGPPTITGATPTTALTTGGSTITLTGTNLHPGALVAFGLDLGANVNVAADGLSLTVVVPPRATNGAVEVRVINLDAQEGANATVFSYVYPPPTLSSLAPASGWQSGGQTITLTGTGFLTLQSTITIGGAPATDVARISGTQVLARTPAGAPGLADVVFTNGDGQSVTLTGGFRYVPAPGLTAISPAHGLAQGGTIITLTGTNFVAGASVVVGTRPASAVTVLSPTSITAVESGGVQGVADVKVINPDGQSVTLPAAYTRDGPPELTAISPSVSTTAGGQVVTLTGTGFLPGAIVHFGTVLATNVNVVSSTQVSATTPAHPAAVVSVRLDNPDGQNTSLPRALRFTEPVTATAVSPASGPSIGGTTVVVTGTGFSATTRVAFGGTAALSHVLRSPTELEVVTPPGMRGVADVVVTSENGSSATLTGGFTYTRSAPQLAAISPDKGSIGGGAQIVVTGAGFAPGISLTLGGVAATQVSVISSTQLRAIAPAHAAGAVDVVARNDDGQEGTLAAGFTFVAPPTGEEGVVADGGTGGLAGEVPRGEPTVSGCTCSSVDPSSIAMMLGGLWLVRRRRLSPNQRQRE